MVWQIPEAEKQLRQSHGVAIPYPDPRPQPDAPYKLAYAKPAAINVVGSYAFGTAVRGREPISIDILVTMPSVSSSPPSNEDDLD